MIFMLCANTRNDLSSRSELVRDFLFRHIRILPDLVVGIWSYDRVAVICLWPDILPAVSGDTHRERVPAVGKVCRAGWIMGLNDNLASLDTCRRDISFETPSVQLGLSFQIEQDFESASCHDSEVSV